MNANRLRDWVKLGLATAVEGSGIGTVARTLRTFAGGARIHVLGYHRVVDRIDPHGVVNPSLCITVDAFRRQMEQLRAHFAVLPFSYVVRAIAGTIELTHDAAAVTFDDGYRDVLVRAAPVLHELGIPATVFVPSGFAGAEGRARFLPHDRLYAVAVAAARAGRPLGSGTAASVVEELIAAMPAPTLLRCIEELEADIGGLPLDAGAEVLAPVEVRALAERGWEIGSHTIGHVVLTHETPDETRRQLVASRSDLERWSGRPCRYFAYCNGFHSPSLVAEVSRAGYEAAVTTWDRPNRVGNGDPYRINRKVLWEAHARSPLGRFSPSLSAAHLHDLFGALALTHPVDAEVLSRPNVIVHPHNRPPPSSPQIAQSHNNDAQPTEVELAH
jgi:peptidoglycan/xylan/chitin deacetylase (PgdA/CDA1 family)